MQNQTLLQTFLQQLADRLLNIPLVPYITRVWNIVDNWALVKQIQIWFVRKRF